MSARIKRSACVHPCQKQYEKWPIQKGLDSRDKIEGDFEALLKDMQPTKTLMALAYDLFSDLWKIRLKSLGQSSADIKASIAQIEKKSEQLMDRIISTDSETLIAAYESQIKKLEIKKIELSEKSPNNGQPLSNFDDAFRTAMAFLANPWKLWVSDAYEHKRMVLRMAFQGRIAYCRKEGFRTAAIAEPIRLLGQFSIPKYGMVGAPGFEPGTSTMSRPHKSIKSEENQYTVIQGWLQAFKKGQ